MDEQEKQLSDIEAQKFHLAFEHAESSKSLLEEVKELRLTVEDFEGTKDNIADIERHTRIMTGIMAFWLFLSVAGLIGCIYYISKMTEALAILTKLGK